MKYKITILSIMVLCSVIITSCGHKHTEGDGHDHGAHSQHDEEASKSANGGHEDHGEHKGHTDHEENTLHLSADQIKTVGLEFGTFQDLKVNDFVRTTGTLGVPPNAYASVSAKAKGIISGNKKYVEGMYIKKGEVISYIENPEFITLQQEYLKLREMLKVKRLEAQRQQTLVDADAGVHRDLQNAKADVDILYVEYLGLAKQLEYLGLATESLTAQTISQKIPVVSPMSGHITSINLHKGKYATPSEPLMDIVASDHLHLELDIFEKDISKVKVGQKVSYTLPALGDKLYEGEVSIIGKEFDTESKTIRVHGHLDGENPPFLKDLFINAKIWLTDETTNALPEEAVIREGSSSIIYVSTGINDENEAVFEKVRVKVKSRNDGFIAVDLIDVLPEGMKIVTKGAYYVYAQSVAGVLSHEH